MDLKTYLSSKRGRARQLAKQIGGYESDISDWKQGKQPVPIPRCRAIESATSGEVTRPDLRPTDWYEIWPELIGAPGSPPVPTASTEAA
ncbi:transcriptional regulator [Paraburkholderia antibiotica]|uniref:Helix-turn-helix domain-containing protein n=1 Tax=Paraburkholderia antibiotica TaxID=2728839 RepID=A0A7Y0A121_9BURK|nr:YdaS family helix-turn-helix protein [Paraburkholderia antibiotica]NML34538.1 helix-turn-helix domain-containing protein [Paraburkholderia antibiotica]